MRTDACFVALNRDGFDDVTAQHVKRLLADPALLPIGLRVHHRELDVAWLAQVLVQLADPETALGHHDIDLAAAMATIGEQSEPKGALARGLAGLLIVAALEGLARRYGRPAEYPDIAVTTIEAIGVPAARLLLAAGASAGAAMLAGLLRQYMTTDPAQRRLGTQAVAACREVETAHARHMSACCRHAAWQLHDRLEEDLLVRKCTAALYFALGDAIRARGIAAGRHVPSLAALVDLVEVSAELAPLDPLLQAVWLLTLGETALDVPGRSPASSCVPSCPRSTGRSRGPTREPSASLACPTARRTPWACSATSAVCGTPRSCGRRGGAR